MLIKGDNAVKLYYVCTTTYGT